jgi:hypothetical protein
MTARYHEYGVMAAQYRYFSKTLAGTRILSLPGTF